MICLYSIWETIRLWIDFRHVALFKKTPNQDAQKKLFWQSLMTSQRSGSFDMMTTSSHVRNYTMLLCSFAISSNPIFSSSFCDFLPFLLIVPDATDVQKTADFVCHHPRSHWISTGTSELQMIVQCLFWLCKIFVVQDISWTEINDELFSFRTADPWHNFFVSRQLILMTRGTSSIRKTTSLRQLQK